AQQSNVSELTSQIERERKNLMESLTPVVKGAYFEATLHCETDKPGAQAFFNEMLRTSSDGSVMPKGISFSMERGDDSAKLNLEVSDSVSDGLYVLFAYFRKAILP